MEVLKYRVDANSPWKELIAIKGEKGEPGLTEEEVIALIEKKLEELGITGGTGGGGGITGNDSTGLEYMYNSAHTELTLVGRGTNTDADIIIPGYVNGAKVVAIAERAFENDKTLKSVVIPNTISTIGMYAFSGSGLTGGIAIPNSVNEIGGAAFMSCQLDTAVIGAKAIGVGAFYQCPLTTLAIENTVNEISGGAFFSTSITSVYVPSSVSKIAASSADSDFILSKMGAFEGCGSLTSLRVGWAQGARSGAPWGATNATITYNATM